MKLNDLVQVKFLDTYDRKWRRNIQIGDFATIIDSGSDKTYRCYFLRVKEAYLMHAEQLEIVVNDAIGGILDI